MNHQAKTIIVDLVAGLFIFLFVYTACSKLLQFRLFQVTLNKSPLIGNNAFFIALGLPIVELVVAVFLFFKPTQKLGLYSTAALMIIFSAYILYMLLFVPHLPCSCGGVLQQMSWPQHFVFNIALTSLAVLAIVFQNISNSPPRYTGG